MPINVHMSSKEAVALVSTIPSSHLITVGRIINVRLATEGGFETMIRHTVEFEDADAVARMVKAATTFLTWQHSQKEEEQIRKIKDGYGNTEASGNQAPVDGDHLGTTESR